MAGRGKWHLAEKTESGIQQGRPTPLSLYKRALGLCGSGDRGCQSGHARWVKSPPGSSGGCKLLQQSRYKQLIGKLKAGKDRFLPQIL